MTIFHGETYYFYGHVQLRKLWYSHYQTVVIPIKSHESTISPIVFLRFFSSFPWFSTMFPRFSYDFPSIFPFSYGFPNIFQLSNGFQMIFLWFSYNFPMVFSFSSPFPMSFSHLDHQFTRFHQARGGLQGLPHRAALQRLQGRQILGLRQAEAKGKPGAPPAKRWSWRSIHVC